MKYCLVEWIAFGNAKGYVAPTRNTCPQTFLLLPFYFLTILVEWITFGNAKGYVTPQETPAHRRICFCLFIFKQWNGLNVVPQVLFLEQRTMMCYL